MWADNGEVFSVYAIGQPLITPLVMKCYENGGVEDRTEIDGIVSLTNTEAMTLEELALENWKEETGVSKVDWYNAVIDAFNSDRDNKYYVSLNVVSSLSTDIFMGDLMRWYEYEITLKPKESIVNTVIAPMYPEIDGGYEPAIYTYTYLLSPASTWASFKEIEININTPFYMTESNIEGFSKTDNGYTYKQNGLPSGELEFTLCSSENPTRVLSPYALLGGIILGAIILGFIAVILIIVGIVFIVVRKKRRKVK